MIVLHSAVRRLLAFVDLASILPGHAAAESRDAGGPAAQEGIRDEAVIVYHRPEPTLGLPRRETWYKRGDRVRIDTRPDDGRTVLHQKFTRPGQAVEFSRTLSETDRTLALWLMDDPLAALPPAAARTFTGAEEVHLGRGCRVWQVVHRTSSDSDFVQSGCVSAEGIELWWRQGGLGTISATSITLTPVSVSEVSPPVERLALSAWTSVEADGEHGRDYRVDLEGTKNSLHETAHAQSRNGSWLSVATRMSSGRMHFSLRDAATGFSVGYSDMGQGRSLYIKAGVLPLADIFSGGGMRLESEPDGTVLGERCCWWDTMPGMMDAGRTECRTEDGVPLIIANWSRGSRARLVATRLSRAPQPPNALMPSVPFQDPAFWGF